MGIVRLFLALSVVSSHMESYPPISMANGVFAVKLFFIISGFYMAMVYRNYSSNIKFWCSRYLRLYPTYFICVICALMLYYGSYLKDIQLLPVAAQILLGVTQLSLLFQDILLWLSIDMNHEIGFVPIYRAWEDSIYQYALLFPAWSLGSELMFYLVTPFIMRVSRLYVVLVCATLLKLCTYYYFGENDGMHFYFPITIGYFALGALIYYNRARLEYAAPYNYCIFSFVLLMIIFYQYIESYFLHDILLLILGLTIPAIFAITKDKQWDQYLGSLAYPVYCSHALVITYLIKPYIYSGQYSFPALANILSPEKTLMFGTVAAYTASILVAMIFVVIEVPVERLRRFLKDI